MSLTSMPADAVASLAASTRRSLTPLSQCSPKGVQPMPTIATRSRIPLLAITGLLDLDHFTARLVALAPAALGRRSARTVSDHFTARLVALAPAALGRRSARTATARELAYGLRLPEVIMDAVGGVEAAEGHLDALADGDGL